MLGTHAPAGAGSEPSYTTGADGVVEVRLSVANARFAPSDLQIPAGKPVRLIVDRPDADACSKQLVLPSLGIKRDLPDNGTATIDIPATDEGTFTMTCGMGMMSGRLIVGGGGGGSGGMPGWVWIAVMAAAAAGALLARARSADGARRPSPREFRPSRRRERGDDDHAYQDHGDVLPVLPHAHRAECLRSARRLRRPGIQRGLQHGGHLRRVRDQRGNHPSRDTRRRLRRRACRLIEQKGERDEERQRDPRAGTRYGSAGIVVLIAIAVFAVVRFAGGDGAQAESAFSEHPLR